ncbi:glycohydrolase toxin TNT-related protein [Corynebacterium mastitidis]
MYPDKALGQYTELIRTNVPLPDDMRVRFGEIAPAFEQPGGGTQYVFEKWDKGAEKYVLMKVVELTEIDILREI